MVDAITNIARQVLDGIQEAFERECTDQSAVEILRRIIAQAKHGTSDGLPVIVPTKKVGSPKEQKEVRLCGKPLKKAGKTCGNKVTDPHQQYCGRHSRSEAGTTSLCTHINKSGKNKNEICGVTIPFGEMYCSAHRNTKCIAATSRGQCGRSISPKSEKHCRLHIIEELKIDLSKSVVVKNYFGNLMHTYTNIVFDDEKKAIGSQSPDGAVLPLNNEDLECILAYQLPIADTFLPQLQAFIASQSQPGSSIPSQSSFPSQGSGPSQSSESPRTTLPSVVLPSLPMLPQI